MTRLDFFLLLAAISPARAGLIPADRAAVSSLGVQKLVEQHEKVLKAYEESLSRYNDAVDNYESASSSYQDILSSASAQGITALTTPKAMQNIKARQQPCLQTITVFQAPPVVTVVAGDSASVASSFAYASQIDSIINENSYQDRPTGEPPETTSIYYTHTASGPAIIGTDDPNDGQTIYHFSAATMGPVATTVVAFPPADTPKPSPPAPPPNSPNAPLPSAPLNSTQHEDGHTSTQIVWTYLSTVTVYAPHTTAPTTVLSNLSVTAAPSLQKRQTCSLIFAQINGQWASWCNNWDGSKVVSHSTYETTTVISSVIGAEPIPTSVYNPSFTTTQSSSPSSSQIQTSSTTTMITTSLVVSGTMVITAPVTTVTRTYTGDLSAIFPNSTTPQIASTPISSSPPSTSTSDPSCGQVGLFKIDFDDLPSYSNKNSNDTSIPPIFSPYSHFFFSDGFGYGPPPNEPYAPHDGTRIGMWNPVDDVHVGENIQGANQAGSFGAGLRAHNSTFWFDAKSVYLGCNSTEPCQIRATGYRWVRDDINDQTKGHEEVAYVQDISLPGICATPPCQLTQAILDPGRFSGLSSLNLQGHVGTKTFGYFFDTFEASWTNSTCAAGRERASSRR